MVAISMRASVSSLELNIGNFFVRKKSRIMPADQTSMAKVSISVMCEVDKNYAHLQTARRT